MDFSLSPSDDDLPFGDAVSSPATAIARSRKRTRPAPAASLANATANANNNDDEVVVLDSSSDSEDDFGIGRGDNNGSDCVGLPSPAFGGAKSSARAGSSAGTNNSRAGTAAASYAASSKRAASATSQGYSDSDSDDDDDDDDDLLSGGPIFASRPGSSSASTGQSNGATEKLKRTLSRLESLSSVASSTGISAASASGKPRKRTAEERAAEAAAKKRQKAREVEARKRAREAERAAKARQKEEAKVAKARQVLEDKQASGKFAAEEICALVDASLARAGADDDSDAAAFAAAAAASAAGEDDAPLPTGLGPLTLASLEAKNYRAVTEGKTTMSSRLGESSSMDNVAPVRWDGLPVGRGAGCIRWIRRDHLAGGSAGTASAPSNDDNVQRTDMVAVVFHNPKAFLKLLERDAAAEARDDYPELRMWLRNVRSSLASRWETRWKSDPNTGGGTRRNGRGTTSATSTAGASNNTGDGTRQSATRIVLVLHKVQEELQRQWNQGGRRRRSFAPTSEEELNDATVWLLIEQHVECTLTSTDEETAEYLVNLTRALSEAPYYDDVTELHCVAKLKGDSAATTAEEKAKCAWMRQVQQLPGLSEAKARKLVEHYPTLMSLLDEYEDPTLTNDEKKCLLEDCLVEGRKVRKLSESMYRLMTSNDPNELIA